MFPQLLRLGIWTLLVLPGTPGMTAAEVDPGLSGKLAVGRGWIMNGPSGGHYDGGLAASATVLRRVASHFSLGGELSYQHTGNAFDGLQCGPEWGVDCPVQGQHIGLWGLGPVARLRAGGRRFHPYAIVGTGAYLTEQEELVNRLARIRRHIEPGVTAGLGFYGLLPGGLGAEARWHTVWNADPERLEPRLDLFSVGVGVSFP